ncbi:MAG: AAA family ATPase [Anaeroplasmataceae bacterium]|nr:AAA family ATPase [Anaeroplasmataceae bacterium]
MKICIIGYAGSGKSTLARNLAKFYNLETLHLDSVHFEANWIEKTDEEMEKSVLDFMQQHENWVIEGNYRRIAPHRFKEADLVLWLKYSRLTCLRGVIRRYKRYKNQTRPDMSPGCKEKLDGNFIRWVLYKGRSKEKNKRYKDIVLQAKEGYIFKNRKKLYAFLKRIGVEEYEAHL